jgi:PAS domain S-box-containing protein
MLGHEPRDFIGHPEFWEGHIHPEDKRVFTAEIPKLWKEGHHSFEYRFLHKDGNYRWMHEEARVLRDSDGKPREVNGYWIDVTARKQMEEDLARAQRLATIGELAAMVGHDLRNPLTGIAGAAYYLKTKLSPKAAARTRQMLELIDDEIKHSDKIVSDLLEYSRELRLELTKTDARSITSHALSEARIPRRIRVVNSTRKKPQIEVDTDKMNRLLLNIIRNAVDAMPQGGTLRITSRESRGRIELSVADTGAGITEEDLRELWNPLFTTKAKGIGLGLPIANRLAEAHGGTITVKTKAGRGSIFTVTVPISKPQESRR